MTRRHLQIGLGLLLSALFLWLASRGIDTAGLWHALSSAQYWLLLPALALYFAGVWVRGLRWSVLLRPMKPLPGSRLFPVIVIGYMANDVLPARLGEVVRAYLLGRREGVSVASALATILVERVLDGLVLLALMALVLPFLPFTATLWRLLGFAGALFAVVAAVLLGLAAAPALADRLASSLLTRLPAGMRKRLASLLTRFFAGLGALGGWGALAALALSFGAWTLEVGMYLVLMLAFGLAAVAPAPAALAALTAAVVNLGTLLPSSPGYVGVFHYLAREVLMHFGVPAEPALGYVLVLHAALVVPITLLGFVYAWQQHLGVRQLAQAANEPRPARFAGLTRDSV